MCQDIFCHQLLTHWSKGSHGNLQTSQATAKAIGYSPQPHGKALLLKTTLTYAI